MSDVQASSDVGRRSRNDKGSFGVLRSQRLNLRLEHALLLPPVVPGSLDGHGVVSGSHRSSHVCKIGEQKASQSERSAVVHGRKESSSHEKERRRGKIS